MSNYDLEDPILVANSPFGTITKSGLRNALGQLGGILVTLGVTQAADWEKYSGGAFMVISLGLTLWASWAKHKRLVTTAAAAPNSVAKVI